MSEHHDCAVQGCAAWGVTRFRGVLEATDNATEIEGWLCESHRGEPIKGVSVGYRLDGEPFVVGPRLVVPQEPKEAFVPTNRAARRAAARKKG